ncbi:MAG: type I DNA topoisomerase [candidate division KSB1 bacterium]|nr:type I DNA topoisomerase [candidate division KSB1 bacterium]MDQ7065763.1 type I DNA topoisomerase [candidate division KSB1 bacterium]
MSKYLVIVESEAKTKTIKKFLGKDFDVKSSVGHVKDLPKQRLGVDLEDGFTPEYITIRGKGKILNDLRKAAKSSDVVYIATDPDREGEAIAAHLAEEIKSRNANIRRVMFNEITERAVKAALENPSDIDLAKVEAQKARRVVDRLVGYQVSPILWRTIYRGLSAGRVQSVALRLICEREEEIENFVPREYWSITAKVKTEDSAEFLTKLVKINGKKADIKNEKAAKEIVQELKQKPFKIEKITKKPVLRQPNAPFTTSTLQQEASRRFGYSTKRIMMIAQQLYEGIELGSEGSVGLITYMRTDSTRIANEALQAVREYISRDYGLEYLPKKPRHFKVKSSAQDAHEAIRPTSMQREPKKIRKYLTEEQYKIYELIWNRFVASQMEAAKLEQTTVDISAGKKYAFRTTGSVIVFRGFLQVYEDTKEETDRSEDDSTNVAVPPNLKEGQKLELIKLLPKQHFTKPPARYTESSLVKELDTLGIGRPSTYAIIISTLLQRKYVERNKRQLVPTELGKTVNNILVENFPDIFNVKFTAFMEEQLDQVESGQKKFLQVVSEFYKPFSHAVQKTEEKRAEIKEGLQQDTDETCPQCGSKLIIRWGRNGQFVACTGYPDCRYTRPLKEETLEVEQTCDKCGRPMIVKTGRFGKFLACSGYPECKNTQPFTIGVSCPNEGCDGQIVERKTRRGKIFYGCSNYPKCDFASWAKPIPRPCPECGNPYLVERYSKAKGQFVACPKCKAEISEPYEEADAQISVGG